MDFLKKVLFGGLIALCMGATMTSCSSDDDNEEYETTAGAPYTGIYQVTYMTNNEGGSVESGPILTEFLNMHMTLETDNMGNNVCKYYTHNVDDYESTPLYLENGTWFYNGTSKTLTISFPGDKGRVFTVKSWTEKQLITYHEEEGEYENQYYKYFYEITWTKVSSVVTIK